MDPIQIGKVVVSESIEQTHNYETASNYMIYEIPAGEYPMYFKWRHGQPTLWWNANNCRVTKDHYENKGIGGVTTSVEDTEGEACNRRTNHVGEIVPRMIYEQDAATVQYPDSNAAKIKFVIEAGWLSIESHPYKDPTNGREVMVSNFEVDKEHPGYLAYKANSEAYGLRNIIYSDARYYKLDTEMAEDRGYLEIDAIKEALFTDHRRNQRSLKNYVAVILADELLTKVYGKRLKDVDVPDELMDFECDRPSLLRELVAGNLKQLGLKPIAKAPAKGPGLSM